MPGNAAVAITQAHLRDLADLRKLEQACFDLDAWPLFDLIGVLTFPGIVRLKAVLNDMMVGFVAGEHRSDENTGWITTIGVLPEFRRMGIASVMLDVAEQRIGSPYIRLTVRRSNLDAIALYEKRGYRQVSVWRRYYSGGEDGLVLEKLMKKGDIQSS